MSIDAIASVRMCAVVTVGAVLCYHLEVDDQILLAWMIAQRYKCEYDSNANVIRMRFECEK